nr:reverse transcriptase domain-containing protein [Tanacetum cinerariifolium]
MNVFMRIGFGSTIELVFFDESQLVTFNGKFICCFKNGDCRTGSRSDNTVRNLYGFIIHGINGNEKVTKDELRTAFISRFFPPALFERLLDEIRAFSQHENESLTDASFHMKEMLRNWHGHNLSKGNIIKIFYHGLKEITQEVLNSAVGGIFLYKTPNQAYQLLEHKVLLKLDWAKNQKTKSSLKKTVAFAAEGNRNFDTDKIVARMDAMTMKMDAQYKYFQFRSKQSNLDDDDIPMSREEEAKFMFKCLIHYNGINRGFILHEDLTYAMLHEMVMKKFNLEAIYPLNLSAKVSSIDDSFDITDDHKKQLNLGVGIERMIFNIDSSIKHSYSNDDTCFSVDVIDEILEEDFDALLDEGSEILHSIEGTILDEKLFVEFDEFMAMTDDENFESESDTEEPPFKKLPLTAITRSKHLLKNYRS